MKNRILWVLIALFMLSFVGATNAPSISKQPQSASVLVGTPATFLVEAAGEDLTYQWTRNGANIPDATTPLLILPSVTKADTNTSFEVKVTNDKGSVVSCRAVLTVIDSGQPSTSPPICPEPVSNGGGGCGDDNGGGGSSSSSTSSSSSSGNASSSGSSGDLPPEFQPYPLTKWKGTVKATTNFSYADIMYTQVVEGTVTFQSYEGSVGLFPQTITAIEGDLTFTRDGSNGGCTDSVRGSGKVQPNDGQLSFQPDPPAPQTATQLKYSGSGSSTLSGTQTRSCPSSGGTTTNEWVERPAWMLVGPPGPEQTTSPNLLVISGSQTDTTSLLGGTTTYEWNLVKQ